MLFWEPPLTERIGAAFEEGRETRTCKRTVMSDGRDR